MLIIVKTKSVLLMFKMCTFCFADYTTAIERDNSENIYITGQAFEQSTNSYDIKTIKLNASLAVQWIQTYDRVGLEDLATTIDVDNAGNVFVGGYVSTTDEGRNFITLKYDVSGNLLWEEEYNYSIVNGDDEVRKLEVNNLGEIYVIGFIDTDNQSNILTIKYDTNGEICSFVINENIAGSDLPTDIKADNNGNIYVTGRVFDGANNTNATIKYTIFDKGNVYELDSIGKPVYLKNQFIVSFDANVLNMSTLSNLETQWGTVQDFLTPNAITDLQGKVPFDLSRSKIGRVFKTLPTTVTYSITRKGDTIPVPKFWTTLILLAPNNQFAAFEEIDICKNIESLDFVEFSHPNYLANLSIAPNDFYYQQQYSFFPSSQYASNPLGAFNGINVESVWDTYGVNGNTDIKVGVFDTGGWFEHEDFWIGAANNPPSMIVGGWDFNNNCDLYSSPNPEVTNHGTGVSGIIGASRNNNVGVAGIAGGNNAFSIGDGVSVYNFIIFDLDVSSNWVFAPITSIADAIEKSAIDNPAHNYGFGIHVANHSWSLRASSPGGVFTAENVELLKLAIHHAHRNGVITIAARGNEGDDGEHFPACYDDNWVISVGGSGSDGDYKDITEDETWWAPNWGKNVDFTAPCIEDLVYTTGADGVNNNIYMPFNGTSAAAPHVSGIVGLLLDYYNQPANPYQNLTQEDCEQLIQKSAAQYPNYDDFNGYGRVNAAKALHLIEKPHKYLKHVGALTTNFNTVNLPNQNGNGRINLYLIESYRSFNYSYYDALDDITGLSIPYEADVYEVASTVNHNLLANEVTLDKWVRNSDCEVLPLCSYNAAAGYYELEPRENIDITNFSNFSADVKGYCYYLYDVNGVGLGWIPKDPFVSNKLEYTLYLSDGWNAIEETTTNGFVKLSPNPATDISNLTLSFLVSGEVSITLYDITGKALDTVYKGFLSSRDHHISHEISSLTNGVYIYNITYATHTERVKFIKM